MPPDLSMNATERLHALSKGTYEICKWIRIVTLLLDFLPSVYITIFALGYGIEKIVNPFFLLVFAAISLFLKLLNGSYRQKADSMRRISARNYALGFPTPESLFTTFNLQSSILAAFFSKRLPTTNLDQYYEPTKAEGARRLQEIYAHSSFYTWDLQSKYSRVIFLFMISILGFALWFFYDTSISSMPVETRAKNASIVCSVIVVLFLFRSFESFLNSLNASRVSKSVAEKLLDPTLSSQQIDSIVMEYEFERATGDLVPTFIYKLFRRSLQANWHLRRKDLT